MSLSSVHLFTVLLCMAVSSVYTANILGVFMVPSISHQIVFQPIWRELSLRGHNVTVVTTDPLRDPSLVNLTEIDNHHAYDLFKANKSLDKVAPKENSKYKNFGVFAKLQKEMVDASLSNPEFQTILDNPNSHFDLILIEIFFPTLHGLSARFNAPLIGISSLGVHSVIQDCVGNPSHPIAYQDFFITNEISNLLDRIDALIFSVYSRLHHYFVDLPQADELSKQYFGKDIPYVGDLEKNMSMLFVNEHPYLHGVRPNVPAVVNLGQMHIKPVKPLPLDLQKYLDNATEGVVYFSLGSNVKSVNLEEAVLQKIIQTLSELPYKVLFKWEAEHMPGKPENVLLRKWLPQQDVLAHPNIKVFVTQGGLQSTEEAISRGVPLVGMPFIGDQPANVREMVKLGIAIGVNLFTVTKDELKAAIIEVAENEKYKKRVIEIRDLIDDQPMTGLQRAVWWCEFVIRHKGARHLRSPVVDMPLHEYFMLDVFLALTSFLVLSIYVILTVFTLISRNYLLKNSKKEKIS